MAWAVAGLHHVAVLHHHHLVGERAHHPQVVADEDVGEAVVLLQPAEEVDDLHLHRHVEGAGRLVEHDELRLQDHRAGDGDALALAAGELVRVAVRGLRVEPDLAQDRGDAARLVRHAVHGEALGDDLLHRHARAKASRRGPGTPSACRGAPGAARGSASPGCRGRGRRCGPRDWIRRMMARPSVVLPEPNSPTTPSVSPARSVTRGVVDRLDVADGLAQEAAPDREPDLQVRRSRAPRRVGRDRVGRAGGLGGEKHPGVGVLGLAKIAAVGPVSTISPACITATRSAMRRTMPRLWVMKSIPMPSARCTSARSVEDLRLDRHVEGGGRLVGDQDVGLLASAIAIITRWRWPPESWCG